LVKPHNKSFQFNIKLTLSLIGGGSSGKGRKIVDYKKFERLSDA